MLSTVICRTLTPGLLSISPAATLDTMSSMALSRAGPWPGQWPLGAHTARYRRPPVAIDPQP
eukprot:7842608-Heterocapsa_arctica.AAC.1